MSSRQKKRLLGGDDLAHFKMMPVKEPSSEESSDEEVQANNKFSNNNFRKFMAEEFMEEADSAASEPEASPKQTVATAKQDSSKGIPSKSKKKKNKKKKGKNSQNKPADPDNIDDLIAEIDLNSSPSTNSRSKNASGKDQKITTASLVKIDLRNLNPHTELHRIFGKSVTSSSQNNQQRMNSQQMKNYYPKSCFVQPKIGVWPPCMNLSMSMVPSDDNSPPKNFRFIHKKDYQKFERKFRLAIELHQDQGFNEILAEKSYHANTLLQLADVYKSQQDFNGEREMLERCLYGLEASFDTRFSLVDNSMKLDYRYIENRSWFICLFQHAVSLSRRACNRTAFEICKLLYKLDDVRDPLSVWLMFDHFALLSGQYDFIISAFSEKNQQEAGLLPRNVNLKALPNWSFSVALAKYRKSGESEASKQMTLAIIKFPGLLALLAEKLNIEISDSEKAKLLSFDSGSKFLVILYKLYVNRSHGCWSGDDILPFLYRSTQRALSALCQDSCEASGFKKHVEAAELVRESYAKLPPNVLRHLAISGFSECSAFINLTYPDQKIYAYDPFPPEDTIKTYTPLEENWRDEVIGGRLDGSALQNFIETMIRPNMTINDMLRRTRDSDGGPDRPGLLEEIRMNLYELLSGINVEGDEIDQAIEGAIDEFREGEID